MSDARDTKDAGPAGDAGAAGPAAAPRRPARAARRRSRWPLLTVVLPALLGAAYYGALAEDRYVSEARFSIRSEGEDAVAGLAVGVLGVGGGMSAHDQMLVRDYILSGDMLRRVAERFDVRAVLASRGPDLAWRLWRGASFEDLLDRWRSMVEVVYDSASSITTVRVQAFDPETARALLAAVLDESRAKVNGLSDQVARQHIEFADREAARTKERLDEALARVGEFQDRNRMLDPGADGAALAQMASGLEAEIAREEAEIAHLRSFLAPGHPRIEAARARVGGLRAQVDIAKSRVGGEAPERISGRMVAFAALKADLTFAERTHAAAMASLETARAKAMREQKHMMVVVSPSAAEEAALPERGKGAATVLVAAVLSHLLLALGAAILKEHQSVQP